MKTLKTALIIAAALLCSCAGKETEETHKLIAPLPAGIEADNMQDCTVPVRFALSDFCWRGDNLTVTVYNMDLYDAVEISQMQVGDTLMYEGKPMIVSTMEEKNGCLEINGGLEEGGCWLAGYEGGTYVARGWDDHATYTELGQAQVMLSNDFVIVDCGMNPEEPQDTIRDDQKAYLDNLEEGRRDFHPLNTTVRIENGVLTEINRRWIP